MCRLEFDTPWRSRRSNKSEGVRRSKTHDNETKVRNSINGNCDQ
ncbi:MAG: hypothetical protein F2857_05150 [Actinobacteria bacterium]|nr:hypothetical protein [Actinomycetota bacterium]